MLKQKTGVRHQSLSGMFHLNTAIFEDPYKVRSREMLHMNFARTGAFQNSAVPTIQIRLNQQLCQSPL